MDIIRWAIKNSSAVIIFVGLMAALGVYSIFSLPMQLFPDIERPRISIQTNWRAASPQEVESEILEPQEEVLAGIEGLRAMQANANQGGAWINLEFGLDTDMQKTLIDVISRMNRIPPLPRDATSPNIRLAGQGRDGPALTYFFLQRLPDNPNTIESYAAYFDNVIRPQIEAVPGVASASMQNGRGGDEEFQIIFDPYKAAELGINLANISNLIGSASDVSGGFVDVGRRRYTLRFEGRYTPDNMGQLVLDWRDGNPVTLADIATIKLAATGSSAVSIQNGNPAISVRIDKQNDANVLSTLEAVKAKISQLNQSELASKQLKLEQSFDASVFIYRAINLVTSNLVIGVLMAVAILWVFLRQFRATIIVGLSIPICLLSTAVVLLITGRSLNVISLAGLAFSVGMVLDAAIVVLESIVRYRQNQSNTADAAYKATKEVFGALVASTATTIAIFIPVIFLKDIAGQLFADLALTIAIAVSISLVVAVTILPAIASKWLPIKAEQSNTSLVWQRIADSIMKLTSSNRKRLLIMLVLMSIPIAGTVLLMPKLDYLPPVKRDAVDSYFNLPAGTSESFMAEEIMPVVKRRLQPYMDGVKQPALKNYYMLSWTGGGTLGVRAKDQSKVKELENIVRDEILKDLPDARVFVMQGNLFGGFGNSRSIDILLQGADENSLSGAVQVALDSINEVFPQANARSSEVEQAEPELQFTPNDRRLMEVGFSRREIGNLIRALGDGMYIGEYFDGVKRSNMIFRSEPWNTPEMLASTPIITPSGELVPLDSLVDIQRAVGPSNIQRINGKRTIVLSFNPPEGVTLEEAMALVREKVEPAIREAMPLDGSIQYAGSANSLKGVVKTMSSNFLFAMGLLFLLMAGLFRSLKDSLFVVLSIPLATIGGVLAIRLLNMFTFQPMDLLTMIGFIILLGLVVNNAILLVHQTRIGENQGLSRTNAVQQAILLRLKPICMSTLTSIFGMLPLLLIPGAGSVIYRGLAAVIVGGMTLSTLFTLILLPTFLQLSLPHINLSRKRIIANEY